MATTPLHDALGLPRPGAETDVATGGVLLATVGGGGKTTLLFALAAERAAARTDDSITVLTTTTKFTVPKAGESIPTVLATNPLVRAAAIADVRGRGLPTVLVAGGRGDRGRLLGVEPSWPAQARGVDGVGFVGVEADGAGGRPFKAPASHEPVIPDRATHVLAVVGVEALGKPLARHWVHRPEPGVGADGGGRGRRGDGRDDRGGAGARGGGAQGSARRHALRRGGDAGRARRRRGAGDRGGLPRPRRRDGSSSGMQRGA